MFHVTTSSDVESIRESGIKSRGIPDYYSPRYELDKAADRIGSEMYTSWVSRVHAVYFWETDEQAIRETSGDHYDRIIEVEPAEISGPVWQLPTNAWENVYRSVDRPYEVERGSETWEKVLAVVEHAERYDGKRTGKHELWCKGPISPSAIVDVREL